MVGSERWVPELSDSHRGITLNAGRLGGILELGEVSLDRELPSQESESDRFAATAAAPDIVPYPVVCRARLPVPLYLSGFSCGDAICWSELSDNIPLRAQES